MNQIIKILKDNALLITAIIAITALGSVVTANIPFEWLTYFFVIIRRTANLFGFMIDLDTLWTITWLVLVAEGAYWAYKGVIAIIDWFKK